MLMLAGRYHHGIDGWMGDDLPAVGANDRGAGFFRQCGSRGFIEIGDADHAYRRMRCGEFCTHGAYAARANDSETNILTLQAGFFHCRFSMHI